MIYTGHQLKEIVFPLGGIGTGSVGLAGNGRLCDFELFNRPNKGSIMSFTHYSLIFNTWAEREHPAWRMPETDTQSRYDQGKRFGLCCPNNREYVSFVKAQIREIADYFPPLEGMFYDMTYWPVMCRCSDCRQLCKQRGGGLERLLHRGGCRCLRLCRRGPVRRAACAFLFRQVFSRGDTAPAV